MKNIAINEAPSINKSKKSMEIPPDNFQQLVEKHKRHELFSPKYPKALRNNARLNLHDLLLKNPTMSLKNALFSSLETIPDWMPPKFVLEVMEAVVEKWEEHHQRLTERESHQAI